jgi:hypothetical protein
MALQWQSRRRISLSYAKHALNRSWTTGSGWQDGLGNTTCMSTYVLYIPSIAASPTLAALPNVHGESPGRTGVRMSAQMTCILTFSAKEEQQSGVATSIPWSEIGVETKLKAGLLTESAATRLAPDDGFNFEFPIDTRRLEYINVLLCCTAIYLACWSFCACSPFLVVGEVRKRQLIIVSKSGSNAPGCFLTSIAKSRRSSFGHPHV